MNSSLGIEKFNNLIKLGYKYTEDKKLMDIDIIHKFLSENSTWALGISREIVIKSVENSLCFAILFRDQLVGFARVITDKSTFANLVDVFVLPGHRSLGLSTWLTINILSHPDLQMLRRFTLATTTAKGLYEKHGFKVLTNPSSFMEIFTPNIYKLNQQSSNTCASQISNNSIKAKL